MPSIATTILAAVRAQLVALFPAIPVVIRKDPVARMIDPATVFLIAIGDAEKVEDVYLNTVLVTYPLKVVYCKPWVEPGWDEDADVRDEREAVRKNLMGSYRTWDPTVNDVWVKPAQPYKASDDKSHLYSEIGFDVEVIETRT